jgi:hypothetical protein
MIIFPLFFLDPAGSRLTGKTSGAESRRRNGSQSGRWIRLSFQGSSDWRFRSREIQSAFQIYKERVLLGIEIDYWRGVRHTLYSGLYLLVVFFVMLRRVLFFPVRTLYLVFFPWLEVHLLTSYSRSHSIISLWEYHERTLPTCPEKQCLSVSQWLLCNSLKPSTAWKIYKTGVDHKIKSKSSPVLLSKYCSRSDADRSSPDLLHVFDVSTLYSKIYLSDSKARCNSSDSSFSQNFEFC